MGGFQMSLVQSDVTRQHHLLQVQAGKRWQWSGEPQREEVCGKHRCTQLCTWGWLSCCMHCKHCVSHLTPSPMSSCWRCVPLQGAALGTMAGLLTYGNRKFEHLDGVIRTSVTPLHAAMMSLLPLVDSDTKAFSEYMVTQNM